VTRYLVRRLLQTVVLLWAVTAIFFTLQRLAPGGPEIFLQDPRLSESDKRMLLED